MFAPAVVTCGTCWQKTRVTASTKRRTATRSALPRPSGFEKSCRLASSNRNPPSMVGRISVGELGQSYSGDNIRTAAARKQLDQDQLIACSRRAQDPRHRGRRFNGGAWLRWSFDMEHGITSGALRALQRKLLSEMATGEMAGVYFAQQRRLVAAAIFSEPAARMKVAEIGRAHV